MVSRNDTDSTAAESTPDETGSTHAVHDQADSPASEETSQGAPARAPRKRASRSRATAAGSRSQPSPAPGPAAQADDALSDQARPDQAPAEEANPAASAPAARKRSRKKITAPEPAATADAGDDTAAGAPSIESPPPVMQDTRMSAATEPALILATLVDPPTLPVVMAGEEDQDEGSAPQVSPPPTFGLLFQAPESAPLPQARAASRRVSRAAAAPSPTSDRAEVDQPDRDQDRSDARDQSDTGDRSDARGQSDTGDRSDARDQSDTDDQSATGDERSGADSADDERGPRRRRRRGGKGRRRDDDSDAHGEDNESGEDSGSDGDADGDDDTEDAQDGGAEPTSTRGRRTRTRGVRGRVGSDTSGDTGGRSHATHDDEGDSGDSRDTDSADEGDGSDSLSGRRRTRRRRRSGSADSTTDDSPGIVTKVREPRQPQQRDVATGIRGSTRLEAKRQRRREGREAGRRRTIITEAEFLARRESVERVMVVRQQGPLTQIGVLEDGVLVEHYISGPGSTSHTAGSSMAGNVYLGRVQNVLPSMEAAFVDIGKGRNAVLYAGEVNWDAAGLEQHKARRIENALSSGQGVLAQVTKDPIGHKGARLTSQVSLPGRYLVYVPDGSMTGISRKLADTERARLKQILKEIVPENAGVIVRTAAEGASEAELRADVERLTNEWERIQAKAKSGNAPVLLHGEPDLTVRVVRDVFNEDFTKLVVAGEDAWSTISDYVQYVADDLSDRLTKWTGDRDVFAHYRIDEQLSKAMDRKVWLPSGGSLVIDRTEAMTVIDVNTGKFTGSGGNLEETVTKNNIEAAEEIVRQLRLRDIGGIIVIDFIDMVLEANRDLVVRRLLECLGRDRTKHQVAEVTSLGLVQMTRKRVGAGLIEVFSEPCEYCAGRGLVVHNEPVDRSTGSDHDSGGSSGGERADSRDGQGRGRGRRGRSSGSGSGTDSGSSPAPAGPSGPTPAQIAAAAYAAAVQASNHGDGASESSAARSSDVASDVAAAVQSARREPQESTERVSSQAAAAVVQAVTRVLDPSGSSFVESAAADGDAQPAQAETAAPARRRGTRRAVRTAAAAPVGASMTPGVFVAAEIGGNAEVALALATTDSRDTEPNDSTSSEPDADFTGSGESGSPQESDSAGPSAVQQPAPKRRKRARVVAPAGPPSVGDEQSSDDSATDDPPGGTSQVGSGTPGEFGSS